VCACVCVCVCARECACAYFVKILTNVCVNVFCSSNVCVMCAFV